MSNYHWYVCVYIHMYDLILFICVCISCCADRQADLLLLPVSHLNVGMAEFLLGLAHRSPKTLTFHLKFVETVRDKDRSACLDSWGWNEMHLRTVISMWILLASFSAWHSFCPHTVRATSFLEVTPAQRLFSCTALVKSPAKLSSCYRTLQSLATEVLRACMREHS